LLYKFIIVLNLLSAVLNLLNGIKNGFGTINYIWVVLGIIFTYLFYLYFLKKSTLEIIPFDQIKALQQKSIFSIKHYSIILNNGKQRNLIEMKTENEFEELKNRISEIRNINSTNTTL
jgi:hypothetical protein